MSEVHRPVPEAGLIVVWPRYAGHAEEIVEEIAQRFRIIRRQWLSWPEKYRFSNFYRFYGDRLSSSSIREKWGRGGSFLLIVFEDVAPVTAVVTTARGIERVNGNFFAQKSEFRRRYGTKFGLHASNDQRETERDLMLLLGLTLDEVRAAASLTVDVPESRKNVTGDAGWKSFDDFFSFINRVEPYAILRNAEEVGSLGGDDDIDFLTLDPRRFALFANAVKKSKGSERANYELQVAGRPVRIDLRYVGDGYFDARWQADCLDRRVLDAAGRYVLDPENQWYTLAYHAFIHKRRFPEKYDAVFGLPRDEVRRRLHDFMLDRGYRMVEPKDVTLNFNVSEGGAIKLSRARRLRGRRGIAGALKRFVYRAWLRLLGQGTPD